MTRTAFLVIHGIGSQNPYETLDSFTQGLNKNLAAKTGMTPKWEHHQVARRNDHGGEWMQQFLRTAPDGGYVMGDETGHRVTSIDVYEHYWAHRMTGQADLNDLMTFLSNASKNAKEFYDKQDLTEKLKKNGGAPSVLFSGGTKPTFNDGGYIELMARAWPDSILWKALFLVIDKIPQVRSILNFLKAKISKHLLPVLGDIAVYVQTDKKAADFPVRQSIIADATEAILALVHDDQYDRVIVAGHSLGSVIAYDALGRINKSAPLTQGHASKLRLVTFGSPLDKIYFFFRKQDEQLGFDPDKFVQPILRSQIIQNQHGLKRKPDPSLDDLAAAMALENKTASCLEDIEWLNFYNCYDPVSGELDAYDTKNIPVEMKGATLLNAHTSYWYNDDFYSDVLDYFVFGTKRIAQS